jgi:branched-chain amino acid aminotransferase
VAECTGDNIFIVKDGVLKTPPTDAGILEGITRNAVIKLAQEAGITVREMTLIRHDIYVADECFLTGTAAEVVPVTSLDGRPIGSGKPGPVTKDLLARFKKLTRGER